MNPESMVLMGDYLIILAFDGKDRYNYMKTVRRSPHLLAVDLRDLSVQQVRINKWGEKNPEYRGWHNPTYLLQKYDENQIIVFDVSKNIPSERYRCSHMLTIESLRRKKSPVVTLFDNFSSSFREMQTPGYEERRRRRMQEERCKNLQRLRLCD